MNKITDRIEADVEAALAEVAKGDPGDAQLVRDMIGPKTGWDSATPGKVRTLALQNTDGRAG